jgi:hypothetical protein
MKLSSLTVAIYVSNAFDEGKSITRASGRGSGPGNRDFFGPCEKKWLRAVRRVPFGAQTVTYIKEHLSNVLLDPLKNYLTLSPCCSFKVMGEEKRTAVLVTSRPKIKIF